MLLAAAALLGVHLAPAYTVQPIITNTPYFGVECFALNDQSQVTYNVRLSDLSCLGYVWKDGTSTEIIAPPGNPNEIVEVAPLGINNDGTVIGNINRTLDHMTSTWEGFSWTASSGTTKLMYGGYQFEPISINNGGDILGNAPNIEDDSNPWRLGILRSSHEFTPLLSYNQNELTVRSFNDHDEFAGIQYYGGDYGHAFRILPGTKALDMLEMPQHVDHPDAPWKNATSIVTAVNNGGWACGFVNMHATGQPSQDEIGAVWSPDNAFFSIGSGYKAWDINDHGQVVGSQIMGVQRGPRYLPVEVCAFVYDSANGVRLLNNLVPYGTPMLSKALAINNKGEILCRAQSHPSDWYLLKPVSQK